MSRVLVNTEAEISVTLTDSDGVPATADGPPTVAVVRDSDGSVVAAGAVSDDGDGVYSSKIAPANNSQVDLLIATWTYTRDSVAGQKAVTYHEVVGGFLCTLAAIESAISGKTAVEKREARDWAEDKLESACEVAFRPRYFKDKRNGSGRNLLRLTWPKAHSLLSANLGGTDIAASVSVEDTGFAYYAGGLWTRGRKNAVVAYAHGNLRPPAPVTRAAVKLARHYLAGNVRDEDERATSMTADDGTFYSLVTPGVRGALTPIPEVNAVITDFAYETPFL